MEYVLRRLARRSASVGRSGIFMTLFVVSGCASTVAPSVTEASDAALATDRYDGGSVVRGKTVCRDTTAADEFCGVEHWTLFVDPNGSRHLHVSSDNVRSKISKQVALWIDPSDQVREAYVHSTKAGQSLGSSYVVFNNDKAYVTVDDTQFGAGEGGVKLEVLDQPAGQNSIGTGPVAADMAQLVDYDLSAGGAQAKSIYWVGGRNNTMVGGFFGAENSFLGKEVMTLVDGKTVEAMHYKMKTGSEVWLLEPYDVVLKMRLEFGPVKGLVYETVELRIDERTF